MNVKPGVGNVSSGVLSLSTPAVEFSSNPNQTHLNKLIKVFRRCVQSGHIALLRALRHENNHGHHIEVSFQTEVLKISHFKGPLGMKDFEGYKWWTLRTSHDPLHDDAASVWRRRALQETVVWSPTPFKSSKLSLRRVNPLKGLGHRDEPFWMETRGNY